MWFDWWSQIDWSENALVLLQATNQATNGTEFLIRWRNKKNSYWVKIFDLKVNIINLTFNRFTAFNTCSDYVHFKMPSAYILYTVSFLVRSIWQPWVLVLQCDRIDVFDVIDLNRLKQWRIMNRLKSIQSISKYPVNRATACKTTRQEATYTTRYFNWVSK